MAFQVSPGVEVKEIDATNVIPAVSTSIGGTAGYFKWGPIAEIMTVSSEKQLADTFGAPDDANTANGFLPAAGFLKYGSTLRVIRQNATGALNAGDGAAGVLVTNSASYQNDSIAFGTNEFIARYAGELGNSISVVTVIPGTTPATDQFNNGEGLTGFAPYRSYFNGPPSTSDFAVSLGATSANDEIHVVVVDAGGLITGTAGAVLETFGYLSQGINAKGSNGGSNYFKDVINATSEYIWFGREASRTAKAGTPTTLTSSTTIDTATAAPFVGTFSNGSNGTYAATDTSTAIELFKNDALVDVNLLFAQGDAVFADTTVNAALIEVVGVRKDLISFISPPPATTTVSNPMSTTAGVFGYFAQTAVSTSSSYVFADSSALYVYDKYNDVYRYIAACGHMAGLCANTDRVSDAWFSPAGQNRGQILGVTKLAFSPSKSNRDDLYRARINPLVSFPGSGVQLFGDKTRLAKPSAFDRINVRRLFIALEKAIANASEAMLFEFNDEFTRANFRNMVEPFLRDVKGRRGITDFLVVCDETNNTGNVVDSNRFVADIYIKPARSINFITLNFVATRTGVEFSEIAGQ